MKKIKIILKIILLLPLILLFWVLNLIANIFFKASNFLGKVVVETIKDELKKTFYQKYIDDISDDDNFFY